jgi:hypothetical protein
LPPPDKIVGPPLWVLRIVLDHDGSRESVNDLTGEDAVLGHLVVSVGGDPDFPARDELYAACTRARDHLLVAGVTPASEFLKDLGG